MDKKTELINILRAELTLLTTEILQNIHQQDLNGLYKSSRKLYEKMAAINLISKQFGDENALNILKPEKKVNQKQDQTPDNRQDTEEKTTKTNQEKTNPYQKVNQMTFIPKEKPAEKPVENQRKPAKKTPVSGKKINIGLNDKIAFINNLFNGDKKAYTEVIDKLNSFDDYEAALSFIYKEIKPQYNHWEGKDEYEFRLIQLLELKFN